jgi:hypothetical protein
VRWLRTNYQLPKLRQGIQMETPGLAPVAAESQPKWPSDDLQQIRRVHQVLEQADGPVTPETIARSFAGRLSPKRKQRVAQVLQTLTATGAARTPEGDPNSYFVPR